MTDRGLVEKRLAYIVECVQRLRKLARPERIHDDPVQRGFVEHTLQTAIQAALDVASAIVSDRALGEPKTNTELFELLAQDGWFPTRSAETYRRIVGFRNIVVHRYLDVDPTIVRAIVESHLEDLLEFVRVVRQKLGG